MEGTCPRCGIAYLKWRADEVADDLGKKPKGMVYSEVASDSLTAQIWEHISFVKEPVDSLDFSWRCALYVAFMLWGVTFIVHGVDWEFIGGSFLHNINLPFHEFGHVLFSPFGEFMMILGGSLFQILMPLIAMVCFIVQMRDNFAASIMLWWTGQNFIDVAPYIADAQDRALPLILGMSEDYHDWGNLLTMLNALDSAKTIANCSFILGTLIMILSGFWGAVLLKKFYRQRHDIG
jgi:hypothetical protein